MFLDILEKNYKLLELELKFIKLEGRIAKQNKKIPERFSNGTS